MATPRNGWFWRTMRAVPLIVLASTGMGCALVDQEVDLHYLPHGYGSAPAAYAVSVAGPALSAPVAQHGNLQVIGNVKNGFGMVTADVVTDEDVRSWLYDAVCGELERTGLKVERVRVLPAECERGVDLSLDRAWVEQDTGFFTIGAVSSVALKVSVVRRGALCKRALIEGTADERGLFGVASHKEESLDEAMHECMAKAIPFLLVELCGTGL